MCSFSGTATFPETSWLLGELHSCGSILDMNNEFSFGPATKQLLIALECKLASLGFVKKFKYLEHVLHLVNAINDRLDFALTQQGGGFL